MNIVFIVWLVFTILAKISHLTWYFQHRYFAKKKPTAQGIFFALLVMSIYITAPILISSIIYGFRSKQGKFKENYRYYLVTTRYGSKLANKLYGERPLPFNEKVQKRLAIFLQRFDQSKKLWQKINPL